MSEVNWWVDSSESSNLITTELDSLANGTESAAITVNNATGKKLYCKFRIVLGSITPGTGGGITLKIYGPNADVGSSPEQTVFIAASSGAGAKVVEKTLLIYPFANQVTVTNNLGTTTASSGNAFYTYLLGEEIP
jgi:hypothetical protein